MQEEIPGVLYKYRDWNDSNHRKLLTDRELWFSSPKGFNDPFDTKLRVSYDSLSDQEMRLMLYQKLRLHSPAMSDEAVRQQVEKRLIELRNPAFLKQLHDVNYEQAAAFFGFVSLAEEATTILLWSHYARSHAGFVIGFNTQELHRDVGGEFTRVAYQPAYPPILPGLGGEDDMRELMEVLNTKAAPWEYEREVRITKPQCSNKAMKFRPESVAQIIIGCNASAAHKQEIIEAAQGFPKASVLQAVISESAFAVNLHPL